LSRVSRGILYMCLAVCLFACMNTVVKVLSPHFSSVQIVWARTLGHLLFVLALFLPRHGLDIIRSQQLGSQLGRSLLQVASTMLYFTALRTVPLAEATSISFLAPMLVTLLAVPMLGEKILPSRMVVVLVGFAGVLIIVRPGSEVFQWSSLLILGSSACYATYQVLTRKVSGTDRAETSAIYSALLGSVITSVAVPFFWTTPLRTADILMLLCLGVFGGIGHFCVASAMRLAPANIMAPFSYAQLVSAGLLGYLVFGDLPSIYTWIGSAIIVASGLYLAWSESRRVG
ncbi:MAG: DMT family transporter, partial [Burkholderiaceae bacterium]|nr:DMT family transporter [Burkholderiaceae bacterium]